MDRVEFLRKKYQQIPEEEFDAVIEFDPTKEKKYSDWLLKLYSKSNIKDSDLEHISFLLLQYNLIKSYLSVEHRDINFFSTLSVFSSVIIKAIVESKISDEEFMSNGAKKIYADDSWLIVSPFTIESSRKYGKSTTWCTASETSYNSFYSYMTRGNLYILINKNEPDGSSSSKYQFHFENGEYKNAKNNKIDVISFFKNNPIIYDVFKDMKNFSQTGIKTLFEGSTKGEDQILAYRRFGVVALKFIKNPSSELKCFSIKDNIDNIKYFKNIDKSSQIIILESFRSKDKLDNLFDFLLPKSTVLCDEVKEAVLCRFPEQIKKIKNIDDKSLFIAIATKPILIKKFTNVSHELKLKLVIKNSDILKYLDKNEFNSKEIKEIIDTKNFDKSNLKYFNLDEKLQIFIVKKDPYLYSYIKNICKKAKIKAESLIKKEEKINRKKRVQNIFDYVNSQDRRHWSYTDCNGYLKQVILADGTRAYIGVDGSGKIIQARPIYDPF